MSHPMHFQPLSKHKSFRKRIEGTIDKNLILPHSIEAGDQYYIGDVYATSPSKHVQEWELLDLEKRPYLSYLKAVSNTWPHLRYLAYWMEVTTSPLKWNLIKDQEAEIRAERAARTNIAVVDFDSESGVSVTRLISPKTLQDTLSTAATPRNGSRLYVVEDLSRDVIEALGSNLDIDPLFFREQISDYWWYNNRDPWVELPDLHVVARERPFFYLRYLRARYFQTFESYEKATLEAGFFNVLRRLDNDKNHKKILDKGDASVALLRSRMSFWWKPAGQEGQGAIGVLLVDPSVHEGFPLWGGYRNFAPTPSVHAQQSGPLDSPPPGNSLLDALVYWYERMSPQQVSEAVLEPRAMLFPISRIILAEWLTICRYIPARLGQIEWELENPDFRRDPKGIDSSLAKLHPWRRNVPLYKSMLEETILRMYPDGQELPSCIESLRDDFRAVEKTIESLQFRIERIVAVATAIISIEESRRAISLNVYLGRLSYLAVIFAPLSFVSSFFSMSGDIGTLSGTFWIYFCVAIPITFFVFIIVDYNKLVKKIKGLKEQRRLNEFK